MNPRKTAKPEFKSADVLVIGAGVAGCAAADRLARAGLKTVLIEKTGAIGGRVRAMGCKAVDVCLRCNVCVADGIFRAVASNAAVRIMTRTELAGFAERPEAGGYRALLRQQPADGRGKPKETALDVRRVIVAVGYEPFDPAETGAFGYGRVANVITGKEAEEQLAGGRPVARPSDGRPPKRVAFIQCVGSRTEEIHRRPEDTNYCSSVCCAYALRIARRLAAGNPEAEVTFFYMDIQNFGKGFDDFYRECRKRFKFVRSRPFELKAGSGGVIRVKYAAESGAVPAVAEEEFDLAVLSVGMRPPADGEALAGKLGVARDERGFFGIKRGTALGDSCRAGIYFAGAAEFPKDIAGSIAQAEAAASLVLRDLAKTAKKGAGARRAAVVVGAGIAGMQTAAALSDLGHRVVLLAGADGLGGAAAGGLQGHLRSDADSARAEAAACIAALEQRMRRDKNIRLIANARLKSVGGEAGNFTVRLEAGGRATGIRAGAVALATGYARRAPAPASGAGETPRPVGLSALMDSIARGQAPRSAAFLLDVAGQQNRAVFIRVLSAAELLAGAYGARVKVFCSHARVAAAGLEELYARARAAGVVVVRTDASPKTAAGATGITVSYADPPAGARINEEFESAVAADIVPDPRPRIGDAVRGLRVAPDGALQYDNVWLLPTLSNRPGVFVVGGARGNSEFREALADGLAAAVAINDLPAVGRRPPAGDCPVVDTKKCALCLTCVRICPHGAMRIDDRKSAAAVSDADCKRCGICASECPARAIVLPGCTDEAVAAAVGRDPEVVVFACENSALPACDAAKALGFKLPPAVRLVRVPCAGKLEPRLVLEALEKGARKALVLGCHPENCRFLSGSARARKRIERLRAALQSAGYDGNKVEFAGLASVETGKFIECVKG